MTIKDISERYQIPIEGIIHVGAHKGQEVEEYLELSTNIALWEPIPSLAKKLIDTWPTLKVVEAAAWHQEARLDFWVTDFSEGSSALHPLEHEVVDTLDVPAFRIKTIHKDDKFNVLVIDTQGSELNVLKGCDLNMFDIIIVETNTRQRYENAPPKGEILEYLDDTHMLVDDVAHSEDGVIFDSYFVKRELVPTNRVVIIPVGGKGTRWDNHLGVPKYLAPVDDVPILDRTTEQLKTHNDTPIIMKKGKVVYGEIDKIYSTKEYWADEGKTIILFGDTFFTDEAIDLILNYPMPEFTIFGRIGPSNFSGKGYGELFGASFYPEHVPMILKAIERIVELEKRGAIPIANLWALYRAYHKFPDDMMSKHFAGEGFVEIHDFTEDFDWPQDYDRFIEKYKGENNNG